MIQDVEYFPARLEAIAFLKGEILKNGEVPVLEALVAKDVATHVTESSKSGGSDYGVSVVGNVAACRCKRRTGGSLRLAQCGGGIRRRCRERLRQTIRICDGACYVCRTVPGQGAVKSHAVREAVLSRREICR